MAAAVVNTWGSVCHNGGDVIACSTSTGYAGLQLAPNVRVLPRWRLGFVGFYSWGGDRSEVAGPSGVQTKTTRNLWRLTAESRFALWRGLWLGAEAGLAGVRDHGEYVGSSTPSADTKNEQARRLGRRWTLRLATISSLIIGWGRSPGSRAGAVSRRPRAPPGAGTGRPVNGRTDAMFG